MIGYTASVVDLVLDPSAEVRGARWQGGLVALAMFQGAGARISGILRKVHIGAAYEKRVQLGVAISLTVAVLFQLKSKLRLCYSARAKALPRNNASLLCLNYSHSL